MPFSQIATSVNIFSSGLVGYCAVSLDSWAVGAITSVPSIAAGSAVEIAGAFFTATEDISITAPTATGYSYLALAPSGTAGSQTLTASFISAAPIWSNSKQGWYTSAASTIRVVGRIRKQMTDYTEKRMFAHTNLTVQFVQYSPAVGALLIGTDIGVNGIGGNQGVAGNGITGVHGSGSTWDFYAGGAGGNYGPFTGAHEVLIKGVLPEVGMILSCTGKVIKREDTISATIPECIIAAKEKDEAVFGVFTRLFNLPEDHWCEDITKQLGICNALGDGQVLVTNKNGNISCGDYITTSEIAGYGEKQDDDLIHSYTLGKCTETIDWDAITTTKEIDGITYKACLIACIYVSA